MVEAARAYIQAGKRVVVDRHPGAPQGEPLSPLLTNGLLDKVGKTLAARDYNLARSADDSNVCVSSKRGRQRVFSDTAIPVLFEHQVPVWFGSAPKFGFG